MPDERRLHLGIREQAILAGICLCAGITPLAARWIANDVLQLAYGLLVAAAFLAVTLCARKVTFLRPFWELSFAFVVFALVQLLNNSIPHVFSTHILHEAPVPGNPLAATVFGTVALQLLETALAIAPILVLTKASGRDLGTIYGRIGKRGHWFGVSLVSFIMFYLITASHHSSRLLPTHGVVTPHRLLALTPALLVLVLSNGFQEELLFRGLFLQPYQAFFSTGVSNLLQASIFAFAHAGVTYTPITVLFIVLIVFPFGLFGGFLMRKTNGIVTPALFHAGADIPIYLAFLSSV